MVVSKVLLLLFFCITLCFGQITLVNPKRVYNATTGVTIKAIGAATTTCSVTLVILDNSTDCFKFADENGVVYDSYCTPDLATSHELYAYASAGYVLNRNGKFIIFDMYTGDIIDVIGPDQTGVASPHMVGLYTSFAVPTAGHTMALLDGAINSSAYLPNWTIDTQGNNVYTTGHIIDLNNDKPVICVFSTGGSPLAFFVVYKGDPHIYRFPWFTSPKTDFNKVIGRLEGFGEITACGNDYYQRGWVWDDTNKMLRVFTFHPPNNGTWISAQHLPEVVNPTRISPTRNKVFIHDELGVIRYDLPLLNVQITQPDTSNCSSARFNFTITGGAPVYHARIIPDFTSGTSTDMRLFSYNYSGTATFSPLYDTPLTVYGDQMAPEYETYRLGSTPTTLFFDTASTAVPAHSGNYSISLLMNKKNIFGFRASTALTSNTANFNGRFFTAIEFWIYVTSDVELFKIDMNPAATVDNRAFYYFLYGQNDIPRNTWHKLRYDLSASPAGASINNFLIIDLSNTNSTTAFIYVDDITLIPYTSTDRVLMVRDYCNATFFSAPISLGTPSNFLQTNMAPSTVSCNAAGATGNKGNDGFLAANPSGGVPPYSYQWTVSASTNANLSNLASTDNYLILYDDTLGLEFVDQSNTDRNFNDNTFVNSGSSALSFEPAGDQFTNDLIFFIPSGVSPSRFQAVEFYINGGFDGGQIIRVGALNSQLTLTNPEYVHRTAGVPALRAGVWTRVRYTLTGTAAYYGLVFTGVSGRPQSRVFLDDIRFISTAQTVTVSDSVGCRVTTNVFVMAPRPLTVVPTVTNVKCYDATDGVISLNVAGGTAPYKLNWTTGFTSATSPLTGLAENSYRISVSDKNNCTTVPLAATATVRRPPQMKLITTVDSAKCYGTRGSITAQVIGGVAPYFFRWSSPSSSSFEALALEAPFPVFSDTFLNSFSLSSSLRSYTSILCKGTENSTSHSGYCSLNVDTPTNSLNVPIFSVGCPGCIDFAQYLSIQLWVKLERGTDYANLRASFSRNNESIFAQPLFNQTSDSVEWQQVTISFPSEGIADYFTITSTAVNTQSVLLDSISLIPLGTFSKGLNVHSGFKAQILGRGGDYELSVIDSNACPVIVPFELTEPLMLSADFLHAGNGNGTIGQGTLVAVVTGGLPPYTYFWPELNVRTDTAEGLEEGTYQVIITDAHGCMLNTTAVLPFSSRGRILRGYNSSLGTGFGVIIAVGAVLAMVSLLILLNKWNHFTHYGPFYCGIINVGVIVAMVSVAVILPEPSDALCIAFPWLLGIGFSLVYGCLFIKTWVLYRVFRKATQMKKISLTPFYILKVLSIFLFIEVVFMIIWSAVDPPRAGYANLVDNRMELQCVNDTNVFWIIFLSFKGAWIIFGAVLAFLTRNISEEYNTSKNIAYAIYNDIVLIVIGIILSLTLGEVPGGLVIVQAAVVFLSFTFTLLILFFPVWWQIYFSSVDLAEVKLPQTKSSGGSSGGSGGNVAASRASHSPSNSYASNNNSSRVDVYTL